MYNNDKMINSSYYTLSQDNKAYNYTSKSFDNEFSIIFIIMEIFF